MRKVFRGLTFVLAGMIVLALVGYGFLYAGSQRLLNQTWEAPLLAFSVSDEAVLEEGERLARIRGCIGCHGMEMEGGVFFDEPMIATITAPDLTLVAGEYSDAELERVIRRGVRKDGKTVWVMPSPMFYHLSDEDLGAIVAYIRSVEQRGGPPTDIRLGPIGRLGVMVGEFPPQAGEIDATHPRLTVDRSDPISLGRYLATTSCTECHGNDFRGGAGDMVSPDLRMVASYPEEDFRRLMRDGVAAGGREVGLMSEVSRGRFAYFTDDEVEALYTFLRSLTSD